MSTPPVSIRGQELRSSVRLIQVHPYSNPGASLQRRPDRLHIAITLFWLLLQDSL